jgi:7-carboxy-7-deazaguanine synthase
VTRRAIVVSELFGPVVQGEGHLAGRLTVFVRTGGCDFACTWCDSMHAVDKKRFGREWEDVEADELIERVERLTGGTPLLVTLSGGNPAIQPLEGFIREGRARGYGFAMETQGTVAKSWFSLLSDLVLSPKGPSAGMNSEPGFVTERLDRCIAAADGRPEVVFKVVVFGEEDYQFARQLFERYGRTYPFYLQAGTPRIETGRTGDADKSSLLEGVVINRLRHEIARNVKRLAERVAADHWFEARVGYQQHSMIWGDKRGV